MKVSFEQIEEIKGKNDNLSQEKDRLVKELELKGSKLELSLVELA